MRLISTLTNEERETLKSEVKSYSVFRIYNNLAKLSKWTKTYKWICGILFALAFISIIIEKPVRPLIVLNAIVWIPGILYAFGMAPIHMIVSKRLRYLTEKWDLTIDEDGIAKDLTEFVDDILTGKI